MSLLKIEIWTKKQRWATGGVMISFYTASLSRCADSGLDDFNDISASVSAAVTCSSVLSIVAQEQ